MEITGRNLWVIKYKITGNYNQPAHNVQRCYGEASSQSHMSLRGYWRQWADEMFGDPPPRWIQEP